MIWLQVAFVIWTILVLIAAMWAMSEQYHIIFATTLRRHVPGMSAREAWNYPMPLPEDRGDPVKDARTESEPLADDR